jgi:LuxR family maltose regulon positive regulatory protein
VKRVTQLESVPGGIAVSLDPAPVTAIGAGKFRVPQPGAEVFRRDRLTALIEQATERPVTVITAPPGAGKTVACAGWAAARTRSRRIAWLSLDEGDRDPGRFWACMTAALAAASAVTSAGPGLAGAGGTPLVPRGREPADDLPGDLVNAVRKLSGSLVLVIDDVHALADSDVLPGLALLIHQAPATLRLILCGRSVPGLHLAKMRLSGALSEVRAADLACTAEEADAYFDHLGLAAGPAERAELLRQTEGWMAGPRLAALVAARDGGVNAGALAADPIVAEYLRDEVLDWQPPAIRQFLRRTSIAERVTAGFAAEVAGEPGSARVLDTLHRENTLVFRDGADGYRYHPFLRQVLLGELRCELAADVPGLFSRAARWYAAHGDAVAALRCAVEAGQWEAAGPLLAEAGLAGALTERVAEFETVIGRLPAPGRADPAVAAALALARLYRGDPDSAEAYLSLATGTGNGTGDADAGPVSDDAGRAPDRLVIELWLATLRLLRQPGADAVASCLPLAERARASAGRPQEHQAAGLLWLALGTVQLRRLEFTAATDALTAAYHQLTAAGVALLAARVRGWLALTAALGGDLSTAAEQAAELLAEEPADAGPAADPAQPGQPASQAAGRPAEPAATTTAAARCLALMATAQVALDRDDLVGAAGLLDQAEPAVPPSLPGEPDLGVLLAATRARVALAEGDVKRARDLVRLVRGRHEADGPVLSALDFDVALRAGDLALAARTLHPAGSTQPGTRPDQAAARARLLLAEGDPATALGLALSAAEEEARPSRRDRVTALLAGVIAARRSGTDAEAAKLLEEALALAEPHDLYRPFLDAGGAVHSAIALLVAPASPVAGFAAKVHERFVTQPSSRAAGSGPAEHEASALTASELAVLRLLRSYMSNQDIADTLFLSVNTVKTHLRSVYYKLGVSSRREAVERGVRLRIL